MPRKPVRPDAKLAALIPRDVDRVELDLDGRVVRLTNLRKPFWPELGITKGDLLRYYAEVSPLLLPHIEGRAMVMRRYPNGATGASFFMKRAPSPRPGWIRTCAIDHGEESVIDFPVIDDLPSLLWVVNLGCIDLNPWYAPCDDPGRPTYLHFDLDPGTASFAQVLEAAALIGAALESVEIPSHPKTTGSKGVHVYTPIVRGPTQHQVWEFSRVFAQQMAARHPALMTAEYSVRKRPPGRVLVDFNQNQWGRTLASVYSVRPSPRASVSTPLTWKEVERGVAIDDFRIDNVCARLRRTGDLWAPLLDPRAGYALDRWFSPSVSSAAETPAGTRSHGASRTGRRPSGRRGGGRRRP
jgi:bifunctional non-homologous end joining protein LigD